jgi:hypothetical protein
VVVAVLLVVLGPAGPNTTAAFAVVELLMMDVRTLETCGAAHKRQVMNLRNFYI